MRKKYQFSIIGIIVLLSIVVLYISNTALDNRTLEVKQNMYQDTVEKVHTEVDILVRSKKQATLSLALTLATNQFIINALETKNKQNLDLQSLSMDLREYTVFKNVWFQVIDKEGINFYRSWTSRSGEPIYKARLDIQQMLQDKEVSSSISVGKYDMTFKSMVPIRDLNGEFIGIFEIITHFNSIAKKLEEGNFHAVILADKKYKAQLKFPFTKQFIRDYYVANMNANEKYVELLEQEGLERFLQNDTLYVVDEVKKYFMTIFKIPDIHGNEMGYIFVFKDLDDFESSEIESLQNSIIITVIFSILVMVLVGYLVFNKQYNFLLKENLQQTKKEKDKIDAILSAQPYMVLIVHENRSLDVNKKFFEFFYKYTTLEEFTKDYKCICDLFVKPEKDDGTYIYENDEWLEIIVSEPQMIHKVAMYKEDIMHHFIVKATKPGIDAREDDFVILTFVDITELKQKDELLFQQSKNASMGEMIGNIAHQWRQPLSIISTSATGMLLLQKLGNLEDKMIQEYCEHIDENAQYLSKTIDDFRDFIKGETKLMKFNLKDNVAKLLNLIESVARSNDIEIEVDVENVEFEAYPNQLLQCYLNIFNNSKDALLHINQGKQKRFSLKAFQSGDKVFIIFKDNGGGINEKLKEKVFDPYFSTKHQTQGTGLGLHMTYNLIKKMGGSIHIENENFHKDDKFSLGAKTTITFPLQST